MPINPCLPPLNGDVRTITTLTSAPFGSHPPELQGQYLRPLRTYSPLPLSSSAVTPMPAGGALGWSKFAVPPGAPAGPPPVQPAKYSPLFSPVPPPLPFPLLPSPAFPPHTHIPPPSTS